MEKLAHYFNLLRIIPRALIILYGISFYTSTKWFMSLTDPSGTQVAFVSTIVGAGAAFFGLYVNSGEKS